jgi:hypothetical protein
MGKFETLLASDENNSPIETTLPSPERIITEEQAEKIMGSKNMISSKKSLERFRVNEEVSHIPFNEDALRIAREKNFTLFFVPEQMSLSTKDKNNFDMKGGWRLFAKAPALDREGKEMEDHLSQIESLIKERVALGSPTPELVTAISEYRKAKPALTAFLRSPDVADQEEAIKLTSGLMIVKILRPSVNDVAVLSSLTGEFPGPTWTHDRDNRSLPSYVDFNSQTQDFSVNSRLSGLRCPSSYCFSA